MKIRIKTNNIHSESPDYYSPSQGAAINNHCNDVYISELKRTSNNENFSYLDLGCAGGQSVITLNERGHIACGIDGSNIDEMIEISKRRSRPEPRFIGDTEIHKKDVHDNWINFKDKVLFNADITKPFELLNDNNDIVKFDIITAWDVLEHPKPEDINGVLDNIKKHLMVDGKFICLINMVSGTHHQCVNNEEWWINKFKENNFKILDFDFNASPRHTKNPLDSNDLGFILKKQ